MKIYHFGAEDAPVLLLLPGTCCHWKSNFGAVIPLLADSFRVLCVSYDGFDETEQTEFSTMLEETQKIEVYLKTHCGGHIRAAYGCSLGGSFVGLLAARQNIHMDYGILGSSDLDQASPLAAKLQTDFLLPLIYPVVRDGKIKAKFLQKCLDKCAKESGDYVKAFLKMFGDARPYVTMQSCKTEAVAIRKIFELYTSSEIGLGGIANQLNLQGIRKIPRQNGTLEDWTGHFIKLILDNPVYCGKIAYGRRTKEKVKGTKNDYQMKRNDDYILTEGQHKGIVSEEVWEKAHAKRLRTGVKQPSKIGRDRVHLLSGLLKCPVCGSPMYTNKHAWTNKDGTYKEIYYYVCSRNRMVRGKHCEYKAMLKKTDIEPMVIEAIREIVRNEEYAQAIKKRIGVQIDTKAVDKELEGYQAKLKEVDLNKTRLEREIDSLPADAKYRERKLHDMTLRLDSLYDVIVELEEKIEDARLRRDAIKQQAITLENIYKIMVNFDCVYNIINDEEKRNVVTALIKEIEIYRNDESEYPLKRIGLNFPVFKDGGEVTELLWDKGNTVETVYFWPELAQNFREVYRVLKPGGTFFICNEANGETAKDDKWTQIINGMTIYTDADLKVYLEQAGFGRVQSHKNKKGWLCVTAQK